MRGACLVLAVLLGQAVRCAGKKTREPEAAEERVVQDQADADAVDRAYRLLVHRRPVEALEVLDEHEKAEPSQKKPNRTELRLIALCAAGKEQDALAMAANMGDAAARREAERRKAAARSAAGDVRVRVSPFDGPFFQLDDLLEHNGAEDCGRRVEAEYDRHRHEDAGHEPADIEDDVSL